MAKIKSLEGLQFNRLTVLERLENNKHNQAVVRCLCSCGRETIKMFNDLRRGHTKSCGCLQKENCAWINNLRKNVAKDLTGQKFCKLTVICRSDPPTKNGSYALWDCQCDCGTLVKGIRGRYLTKGDNKTCGSCETRDDGFTKYKMRQYMGSAKKRHYEFLLTEDEFKVFLQGNCYYCGSEPKEPIHKKGTWGNFPWNGVDRVDNNQGYVRENCVTCCTQCNTAKGTLSHKEFIEWIEKVYQRHYL